MNPIDQYMKKLEERHEELKQRWDACLMKLTAHDEAGRERGLRSLIDALGALQGELTSETTPSWLPPMISHANALLNGQNYNDGKRRIAVFRTLSDRATEMQEYKFNSSIGDGINPLLSLDEVIAKHHDQGAINKIYDKAIKAIEDALIGGEIDSARIRKDLQRILKTIEEAKKSSFVNQLFQIPILQEYLKAVAKVSAKRVPVLNFVLEVVEEANKGLGQANVSVNAEIKVILEQQSGELGQVIEHQPILAIEHKEGESKNDSLQKDRSTEDGSEE